MVQSVNSYASKTVYKAGPKPANLSQGANPPQAQDEPAATLTLSDEAQKIGELMASGVDERVVEWVGVIKAPWTPEEGAALKAEMKKDAKYASNPDEVETKFKNALREKTENYRELSFEIGKLLSSYEKGNGATVEERAANRATGLKLAEYVANTFLDDPDEAAEFMKNANLAAESDEWREKGYNVGDLNPESRTRPLPKAVEVDPSIPRTNKDGSINFDYIKAYFESYIAKFGKTGEKYAAWESQKNKEFSANENRVNETLKKAKNSLDAAQINNNLQALIKNFGLPQMFGE